MCSLLKWALYLYAHSICKLTMIDKLCHNWESKRPARWPHRRLTLFFQNQKMSIRFVCGGLAGAPRGVAHTIWMGWQFLGILSLLSLIQNAFGLHPSDKVGTGFEANYETRETKLRRLKINCFSSGKFRPLLFISKLNGIRDWAMAVGQLVGTSGSLTGP